MKGLVQEVYYSNKPVEKTAHYHDCHQIILILSGEMKIVVNDRPMTAGSGDIVIFSRYENHTVEVTSRDYERYVLQLTPMNSGIGSRVYGLLSSRPENFKNVIHVGKQVQEFKNLFGRIMDEHSAQEKLTEHMLQLLVNELLIKIYRKVPDTSNFEEQHTVMVYEIQQRFEAYFQEQYTMEELAKAYSISISSLSHQFKKATGSSVMGYLLACRMASAKSLLIGSEMSIGQIVEKCGFSDSSNFSRTFKKLNGISPTEFREAFKKI